MELLTIYLVFFRLGLFSFGGGYVMLPLLYQQIEISGLLPLAEFPDILALSQMTPGPIAINAATYIGFRNYGLTGAFVATLGVMTPSILLTLLVVQVMRRYKENSVIKAILEGVRPVTVGMIAVAAVYFSEITVFNGKVLSSDILKQGFGFFNIIPLLIFIPVLFLTAKTKVNPIIVSISAGVLCMLFL